MTSSPSTVALGEGAPRLGGDPAVGCSRRRPCLLEARVQLDLVDRGRDAGLVDEAPQVGRVEVRHADRADDALLAQLDERLPRLDVEVLRGHRPVDQVEVHELELEPVEALLEGVLGLLITVVAVEALGRDEDLVAVQPRRRGWPGPPRPRSGRRRPCRCGGSRARTRACSGLQRSPRDRIWKTPNPSCGISVPSFSSTSGNLCRRGHSLPVYPRTAASQSSPPRSPSMASGSMKLEGIHHITAITARGAAERRLLRRHCSASGW